MRLSQRGRTVRRSRETGLAGEDFVESASALIGKRR
jgi:hypothetical protein